MPRLTPEELHEAKRRKAEERKRQEEEERMREEEEAREWEVRQLCIAALRSKHRQLTSYTDGIYQEVSKLSIKWPTQEATEITVEQTNRAIRELHELMAEETDMFVDEIKEFVPAGDMPEIRDIVLVLNQVRQALKRMETTYKSQWNSSYFDRLGV